MSHLSSPVAVKGGEPSCVQRRSNTYSTRKHPLAARANSNVPAGTHADPPSRPGKTGWADICQLDILLWQTQPYLRSFCVCVCVCVRACASVCVCARASVCECVLECACASVCVWPVWPGGKALGFRMVSGRIRVQFRLFARSTYVKPNCLRRSTGGD